MTLTETVLALNGKTIQSVEVIPAEHGRTYSHYTCIVFTDNTRTLIGGTINPYEPQISSMTMKRAPKFFTEDAIMEQHEKEVDGVNYRRKKQLHDLKVQVEQIQKKIEEMENANS